MTAADSSLGLWQGQFGDAKTKRDALNAFLAGESIEKWAYFLQFIDRVHGWMISDASKGCSGMPVMVFGKHEPIPVKKVLKGKHRTIGMPDWSVLVIETAYNMWLTPEDTYCNYDHVYAQARRGNGWGINTHHLYGGNTVLEMPKVEKELGECYDYDVEAWDRSLPEQVIVQLFKSLIGGRGANSDKIALSIALGINKNACYVIGDECWSLPEGTVAWVSGQLLTLTGNSHMHSSLLNAIGAVGIVCGDDGNVATTSITQEKLVEGFADVGLRLKKISVQPGLNFCKIRCVNGIVQADIPAIVKKMAAKRGYDSGDVCGDALLTILKFANQSGEFKLAGVQRFTDAGWEPVASSAV